MRIYLTLPLLAMAPLSLMAHCDTLDGPVVHAARKALDTGDVRHALIWVQPDGEAAIRDAFTQTVAVRRLNAQSRALADRYFFETLVRIHRAGEGAPYTGIKDHGEEVPADRAIENGSADEILAQVRHELTSRLAELRRRANYGANVAAGRDWVKAYVEFVHYVENLTPKHEH